MKKRKYSTNTTKLYFLGGVSALAFFYANGIQNSMWWNSEKLYPNVFGMD